MISLLATLAMFGLGLAVLAIAGLSFAYVAERRGNGWGWLAALGAVVLIGLALAPVTTRLDAIRCADCLDPY